MILGWGILCCLLRRGGWCGGLLGWVGLGLRRLRVGPCCCGRCSELRGRLGLRGVLLWGPLGLRLCSGFKKVCIPAGRGWGLGLFAGRRVGFRFRWCGGLLWCRGRVRVVRGRGLVMGVWGGLPVGLLFKCGLLGPR
ncbi:hypothetical protein IQ63_14590 [Streptomyces acidiscabies]|uniref:Uncharacterized protein n=1 Tax=Streptomyces acidiscabies TaxID=42234 RepID=A0A0L0KB72_9ACTN|nr:hypothetical protein IQ63_14590 [Streptomyces acidiscabies]